jgi:hypothetical protein
MTPTHPLAVQARGGARVRASDDDRSRATSLLAEHYAEGRLDDAELDVRSSRALVAVYTDQLRALFDDLPGGTTPGIPSPGSPFTPPRRRVSRPPVPTAAAAPPWRAAWLPALVVGMIALVVLTRGAALWLLLVLWWMGRPLRAAPRSRHWEPVPWRSCRQWSAPGR